MKRTGRRILHFVLGSTLAAWPARSHAESDGSPVCVLQGDQTVAAMAPDGQGGGFAVWLDWRASTGIDLGMQRLVGPGTVAAGWPVNGVVVSDAAGDQVAPCVVADGWGGVYVVWEDLRGADPDLRAQHFDAFGRVQPGWPAGGLLVCGASGVQSEPAIAADGGGGAFIAWSDHRVPLDTDIYIQHVSALGVLAPAWPADGKPLCRAQGVQRRPALVADGRGGALLAWEDDRDDVSGDIYAQRVSADLRTDVWGANGLDVCIALGPQEEPRVAADDAGGAFVVWQDLRGPTYDVYAHHITGAGAGDWGWAVDGSPICDQPGGQLTPRVVADGAGGAIVAWIDSRAVTDFDIYALRIAAHSPVAPGWPSPGVALCSAPGDQVHPQIAGDAEGGAFVCWTDHRNVAGSDVYVQRITALGILPACWPVNGARVCGAADDQETPIVVADGRGRGILAWTDWRSRTPGGQTGADVYGSMVTGVVEAIDPIAVDGTAIAAASGDQLPNPSRPASAAVPDGSGGAYIAWEDARGSGPDVFVQRVGLDGRPAPGWPPDGVAVSTAAGARSAPTLLADSEGGVYVAWQEQVGAAFDFDIFLQRLDAGARLAPGWPREGVAVCTAAGMQLAPRLALDAQRNVFVVWEDSRAPTGPDVYAARITPQGGRAPFWPANGIVVCDRPGPQVQLAVVGGGAGALVFWSDGRFGERHLYGVGVATSMGTPPNWAAGGTLLCRASGHQLEPVAISDGAGGAVVCWIDLRDGRRVAYALRMSGTGNRAAGWPEDGAYLVDPARVGEARDLRIDADGTGGVVAAWFDRQAASCTVRAQHLLGDGTHAGWPLAGARVTTSAAPAVFPAIASDLHGGALVVWVDLRAGAPDVFAQHLNDRGTPLAGWSEAGRPVCAARGPQSSPEVIVTPGCGAIVCWYDERGANADVYAARVELVPRATDAAGAWAMSRQLAAAPNPFRGATWLRIASAPGGDVDVDVYDVAGRWVRHLRVVDTGPGERQLQWDGRDDRGAEVPAGTYLVQVRGAGFAAHTKLVRAR